VPDDISVVGFDDIAVAAHMHPSLTTVRQDAVAWGRAATRAVFDQVEHGRASDVELAPARLVIRGSTAQAPARVRGRRRRTASTIGTPSRGKP
jgi:DNA-binding LacI/PurR family transcriptional regulator